MRYSGQVPLEHLQIGAVRNGTIGEYSALANNQTSQLSDTGYCSVDVFSSIVDMWTESQSAAGRTGDAEFFIQPIEDLRSTVWRHVDDADAAAQLGLTRRDQRAA